MGVRVEVSRTVLDVHVTGADRVWGLRSRIEIPLSRVLAARVVAAGEAKSDVRLRVGGLGFPGLAAVGHFRGRQARRQWWRVYRAEQVLVIDLDPSSAFDRIVLQLADPGSAAARIGAALDAARRDTG